MRYLLAAVLVGLLLRLQYRLWFAEGNVLQYHHIRQQIAEQNTLTDQLQRRNQILAAKVVDLQNGLEATEDIAREKLGMIHRNETFFLIPSDPHRHDTP